MALCSVRDLQAPGLARWPRQGQGLSQALGEEGQEENREDRGVEKEREKAKAEAHIT